MDTYARTRARSLSNRVYFERNLLCTLYSRRRSPLPSSRIILSRIEADAFCVSFDSFRAEGYKERDRLSQFLISVSQSQK